MVIVMIVILKIALIIIITIIIIISNGNRIEWSTIQGLIGRASDFESAEHVTQGCFEIRVSVPHPSITTVSLKDEPFTHMTMTILFVLACPCLHGECESGVYGTGHCKPDSCDLGYTGQDCNTSKCHYSVYSY